MTGSIKLLSIIICVIIVLCIIAVFGFGIAGNAKGIFENFAILQFLEKRGILGGDDDGLSTVEAFLNAAQCDDTSAMLGMFAPAAITEVGAEELTAMLTDFADYFCGDIISVDAPVGAATSEDSIDGRHRLEICAPYVALTSEGEYRLAVRLVPEDEFEPDNIGIWSVYIIESSKDAASEHPYKGDMAYRTGVYMDVPRLR